MDGSMDDDADLLLLLLSVRPSIRPSSKNSCRSRSRNDAAAVVAATGYGASAQKVVSNKNESALENCAQQNVCGWMGGWMDGWTTCIAQPDRRTGSGQTNLLLLQSGWKRGGGGGYSHIWGEGEGRTYWIVKMKRKRGGGEGGGHNVVLIMSVCLNLQKCGQIWFNESEWWLMMCGWMAIGGGAMIERNRPSPIGDCSKLWNVCCERLWQATKWSAECAEWIWEWERGRVKAGNPLDWASSSSGININTFVGMFSIRIAGLLRRQLPTENCQIAAALLIEQIIKE